MGEWLHSKVIWLVGEGAYIGSANLTDRAWMNNIESGIYFTQSDLEENNLINQLEIFFDNIHSISNPLNVEEFETFRIIISERRKN